jgi:hypothetical protein
MAVGITLLDAVRRPSRNTLTPARTPALAAAILNAAARSFFGETLDPLTVTDFFVIVRSAELGS